MNPRRHLVFGYGDARELISLIFQAFILVAVIILFGSPLLIIPVLIAVVLRFQEIHRHASDPWYYVLRRTTIASAWAPERSASTTIAALERFTPDEKVIAASLSPWMRLRRWFDKDASFGPKLSNRNRYTGLPAPIERPMFGLPIPSIPGISYPTGREMINATLRSAIATRLGLAKPLTYRRISRHTLNALPDALPWRNKADAHTIRDKDESYVRSWRVYGSAPDSTEILGRLKERFDATLIKMPLGCTFHGLIRVQTDNEALQEKTYPLAAAALIAQEELAMQPQVQRITVIADIHLVYAPHRDPENNPKGSPKQVSIANYQRFVGIAAEYHSGLERSWDTIVPLGREGHDDEQNSSVALPLTFGSDFESFHGALRPDALLANVLGRHHLSLDRAPDGSSTGYVRIDDRLVAPFNLYDIEAQDGVKPDALRLVEGHQPPMLLSFRWTTMTPTEERKALKEVYDSASKNTEHAGAPLSSNPAMPNLTAYDDANESMQLDRLVQRGAARLGFGTLTLALYERIEKDGLVAARERLSHRVRRIQGHIHHDGYSFSRDVEANLIESVLGMLPGNLHDNSLTNPLPSGHIANLFTTYRPWLGSDVINDAEKIYIDADGRPAPSLWNVTGLDRRRFGWAPGNGRGGGHTIFFADTGGGKSTLIAKLLSEYTAYDVILPYGAGIINMDRDGSNKIHAATHHAAILTTGDHTDRGLNPFLDPFSEEGQGLIIAVVSAMIKARGGIVDEAAYKNIDRIIAHLQELPLESRTADALLSSDIDIALKKRLNRYTSQYAGMLFCDTRDSFNDRYTYIDLAPALSSNELRLPVILSLMSAIERTATTQRRPMILVAEEFWELLQDEKLAEIFIGWLKRLRKFGVWIWLVVQGLEDIDLIAAKSEQLKNTIKNFVFLPSAKHYDEKVVARLQSIGITPAKAELLSHYAPVEGGKLTPVLNLVQGNRDRMLPYHSGPVSLALCGSTDGNSRKRFAELLLRHDGDIDAVTVAFILERGGEYREQWADEARRLTQHYRALREQHGIPTPRYDPRLFDTEIRDIAPYAVA